MHIIRHFSACPANAKGAVVALGNFDGVHAGHQAILSAARTIADASGCPAAVMTFEPHPREFFAKQHSGLRIFSLRQKLALLTEKGRMDTVFLARFNRSLASLSAEAFVEHILKSQLGVRHIVTGENFAFGAGRSGNTATLQELAKKYGFGYTSVPAICSQEGQVISSSAIRSHLSKGNIPEAVKLLGSPYIISGRIARGAAIGRQLGYPTANLPLHKLFIPKLGVYAARAYLCNTKETFNAVVSIGTKPTFKQVEPLLEAHCFGLTRECYGEKLQITLLHFLRGEERFDSTNALREQIALDCANAKDFLSNYRQ